MMYWIFGILHIYTCTLIVNCLQYDRVCEGEYENVIPLVFGGEHTVSYNHLDVSSVWKASCVCVVEVLNAISLLAINVFICSVTSHLEVSSRDYLEMSFIWKLVETTHKEQKPRKKLSRKLHFK